MPAWPRTRQKHIAFIQVRHEEAAAFAACGYAKCDGQPVLAITGHTFHDLMGTHYQQDVDLDKLFSDEHRPGGNITKHSAELFAAAHPVPPQELLQQAAEMKPRKRQP